MAEYPTYGFQSELQSRSSAEVVIESTIMITITTTAIFGNIMVCLAVFRNRRLRTIPNIYVTSLAISDMLMAIAVMPVSIEVLITSKFMQPFSFCQFQGFFGLFSGTTSIAIMTAMAVNRYYCVVKPSKYGKYFTVRRTIASVVVIIALVVFGAGLHLVCGWAINTIHYGKVTCFSTFKTQDHEKGYIAFISICYLMFPASVISVCYLKVYRHTRIHEKTAFKNRKEPSSRGEARAERKQEHQTSAQGVLSTKPSLSTESRDEIQGSQQGKSPKLQTSALGLLSTKPSSSTESRDETLGIQQGNFPKLQTSALGLLSTKPSSSTESRDETQEHQQRIPPKPKINVKEVKITRTLFATVLGYMACWIPVAVIDMIESLFSDTLPMPRQVFLFWIYLGYASSAINPFIYGALNRSFRNEFRSILQFKRRNQIDVVPQAGGFRRNAVQKLQT